MTLTKIEDVVYASNATAGPAVAQFLLIGGRAWHA